MNKYENLTERERKSPSIMNGDLIKIGENRYISKEAVIRHAGK